MHIHKKSYNLIAIDYLTAVIAWVIFFYFRKTKNNTSIPIQEFGRTVVSNGVTIDQIIVNDIRQIKYYLEFEYFQQFHHRHQK